MLELTDAAKKTLHKSLQTADADAHQGKCFRIVPKDDQSLTLALAVIVVESSLVVTYRIVEFPKDAWALAADLEAVPPWLAWLFIVTAAAVAAPTRSTRAPRTSRPTAAPAPSWSTPRTAARGPPAPTSPG